MDNCGFWMQNDLLRDLAQLMDNTPVCMSEAGNSPVFMGEVGSCGPSTCDPSGDVTPHILFDGFTSFDPLEMMRSDAHEEFLTNGVDVELDELDMYQSQLRERTSAECGPVEHNPVLLEYLKMKERRKHKKTKRVCVFCKNNGEPATVYQAHVLKDARGRTSCPILRRYTCPLCGACGHTAHTIRYCPRGDAQGTLLTSSRLGTGKATLG